MMKFLSVMLGGAVGAAGRYAISLIPIKTTFPILTLITNIIGALLIGFIVGITVEKNHVSPNLVLSLKTGVCGGFTTFSTFSLETFEMFGRKQYIFGSMYIFLSVMCCIIGVWCGKVLAKYLTAK